MPDPDRALSAYLQLAAISHLRSQALPRDRFLVLAGAAACLSGCLHVAGRCQRLIVAHNPQHLLSHFESFPAAYATEDFQSLHKQLLRFCSYELAEHLLEQQRETLPIRLPDDAGTLTREALEAESLRLMDAVFPPQAEAAGPPSA